LRDGAALIALQNGPFYLVDIVATRNWPGWLLPCGLFVSVAAILPPVAAWAARSRSLDPAQVPVG
jgi:hypothetical protein